MYTCYIFGYEMNEKEKDQEKENAEHIGTRKYFGHAKILLNLNKILRLKIRKIVTCSIYTTYLGSVCFLKNEY